MIWFIPDEERDTEGNKTDYILKQRKPQKYAEIKERATNLFNRHKLQLDELFN